MSQSDHTTNFHDYVIISVHIRLYFVSVAQFFAKHAQFLFLAGLSEEQIAFEVE